MKSWKSRLLMVFTMLAVILVISVPAMAEDIEVECEADSGVCEEQVTYEIRDEDSGLEPQEELSQEELFADSAIKGLGEKCFPFCMR